MSPRKKPPQVPSGSPSDGEPEYLLVGTLRRPHGLQGEMLMDVVTDFPERIQAKLQVFVGSSRRPAIIVSRRLHNHGVLVRFGGIDTPDAAGAFRNQSVYVKAVDRPPLPKGLYYHHQLVGSTVLDEHEQHLGVLSEILQTGANDVYVVKTPNGGELLLPVLASVVLDIDVDLHRILVRIPDGLEGGGGG